MCGRYWIDDTLEQRQIAEEMMRSALVGRWKDKASVKTHGEIRPTDVVPVIAPNRYGARTVYPMKWGYTGRSLLINARSETAAGKPTFREDWARHRCIVPASWYFEWEHYLDKGGRKRTGDKYMIRPQGAYTAMNKGDAQGTDPREPGEKIRFIHDRMPLIMPGELVNEWIRPDTKPEELMPYALTDMDFEKAL